MARGTGAMNLEHERNFVKERWNAALGALPSVCMFLCSVEGCHKSRCRVGFPLSSQSVTIATQKLRAHKVRSKIKDGASLSEVCVLQQSK